MVIKERTLIAGAAVAVALMVAVVAWRQVTAPPRRALVRTISTGEEVDLVAHMPDSGRTIVEFTADW